MPCVWLQGFSVASVAAGRRARYIAAVMARRTGRYEVGSHRDAGAEQERGEGFLGIAGDAAEGGDGGGADEDDGVDHADGNVEHSLRKC